MFEIIYHPLFSELNQLDQPKPFFEAYETPLRTRMIWNYLKKIGYVKRDFKEMSKTKKDFFVNSDIDLVFKQPEIMKKEDLYLVHSKYHVELVEQFSKVGSGQIGNLVQATPDTFHIASLSAGGAYEAISNVYERKCNQSFAIIRPPGHHAIADASDGLCVFNNIAIAIRKLQKDFNFKGKIAIIDIDTHYGDGISKIFYEDPKILYTSIHEFDFSTGEAGFFTEMGANKGLGTTINFPIPLKCGDSFFQEYCSFIEPFLEKFSPELIIVAAGFDGHFSDPIGNLTYTSRGYKFFADWLKKIAEKVCSGRISFCLEGGYNLLILPRLIETIISSFIPVKPRKPIDDVPFHLRSIFEEKDENVEMERLRTVFKKRLIEFKQKLNRLW